VDTNQVIAALVGLSCGLALGRSVLRRPPYVWGWIAAYVMVIALAGITYFFYPDLIPLAGIAWIVFIILPIQGFEYANRLAEKQQYRTAYRVISLVRFLHPFDGWWRQPRSFEALVLAAQGKTDEARTLLGSAGGDQFYTALQIMRIEGRWDELCRVLDSISTPIPALAPLYLRSLGETGQIDRMLTLYGQMRQRPLSNVADVLVCVFAFAGQPAEVEHIFQTIHPGASLPMRAYWSMVADFAAGNLEWGIEAANRISAAKNQYSSSAQRHLLRSIPSAVMSARSSEILALAHQDARSETLYGQGMRSRRAWITIFLVAINIAVFILETQLGGSENIDNLYRFGAIIPAAVTGSGEWWRLLTAMFLHYGYLHIALNMFALLFFGPRVERLLGWVRYTIVYMASGLGVGLMTIGLAQINVIDSQDFAVGASGAITGIIGALGAILLYGWLRDRSIQARRTLVTIGALVLLEALFDLAVLPYASMLAHLSGTIIGFLLTLVLFPHGSQVKSS
jgi:rhomboid protease GluP